MPSSYMPLRSAFVAAANAGIDRTRLYPRLLRDLRNGAVKAICASYVKAQFLFCGMGRNYAEVVDQLILPAQWKQVAKQNEPSSTDEPHNLWLDGDYYTFLHVEGGVVAYADRNPQGAPGGELSHEFLTAVLINEERSEIYCVDVENQLRRTYEKVELLRSDFNNMIGAHQEKATAKRGKKQQYFMNEEVLASAKTLLRLNLSRRQWEDRVREVLPSKAEKEMGEKTFQKLYGHLWTAHTEQKRKRGI